MATSRLKLISGQAYLYAGSEGIYQVITGQAQELTGQDKVVASGSLQVTGSLFLQNQASAPTPGAAEAVVYARGGTLYFKNSGGSETAVGGGGGVSDGDKGDITVSSSGATWTIDNLAVTSAKIAGSAVTYAKIQNVSATDKLLGRSTAGAGVVEEITCTAAGRALIDDADASAQRTTLGLGSLSTLSTVSTSELSNSAVTYAKIQNVSATDKILGRSTAGSGVVEEIACTSAGRALLDDADASAQRTTLGLGTIATQAASNVSISGGSITGITDLAIADGGTGASDAATARSNLGLGALATLSSVSGTFNDVGAKLVTTASVSVAGTKGFTYDANSAGTDVFFFVSGSTVGGANSTALFGGRAVVSGNLFVHGGSFATNATSFNLLSTTATTINFAGAGTTINVGAASGFTNVKNNMAVTGSLISSGTLTYLSELYVGGVADASFASQGDTLTADKYDFRRYVRVGGNNGGTVELPVASAAKGRVITFVNSTDNDVVTLARNAQDSGQILGQTIATTWALDAKEWLEVVSTGVNWVIVCGGTYPNQTSG